MKLKTTIPVMVSTAVLLTACGGGGGSTHKTSLNVLIALSLFLSFQSVSAKSNDPLGNIYINKPRGDLSNCGPIAALMATKYTKPGFRVTDLRKAIGTARKIITPGNKRVSSRWWSVDDIKAYLKKMNISHSSIKLGKNTHHMRYELDRGNILIINVNMNHLPKGFRNIGKPYLTFPIPGGWGHYLVVVGYSYVGEKLVFETHDSFRPRGKSRFFLASNIHKAVKRYNPEVLVIRK